MTRKPTGRPTGRPRTGWVSTQHSIHESRKMCGPELWEAFDAAAWKHGAAKTRVGPILDEAERWLRDYERKATSIRVHPPENDSGVMYTGGGLTLKTVDCTQDYRGELIEQALAGDEYAQWRCKELYGEAV